MVVQSLVYVNWFPFTLSVLKVAHVYKVSLRYCEAFSNKHTQVTLNRSEIYYSHDFKDLQRSTDFACGY